MTRFGALLVLVTSRDQAESASTAVMVSVPAICAEVAISVRNTTGTFHSIAIYEAVP